VSGVLMAAAFAIEWLVSIYQMWFFKQSLDFTETYESRPP
jgi:hypothetical protein